MIGERGTSWKSEEFGKVVVKVAGLRGEVAESIQSNIILLHHGVVSPVASCQGATELATLH
jgi:hypothetical protein